MSDHNISENRFFAYLLPVLVVCSFLYALRFMYVDEPVLNRPTVPESSLSASDLVPERHLTAVRADTLFALFNRCYGPGCAYLSNEQSKDNALLVRLHGATPSLNANDSLRNINIESATIKYDPKVDSVSMQFKVYEGRSVRIPNDILIALVDNLSHKQ